MVEDQNLVSCALGMTGEMPLTICTPIWEASDRVGRDLCEDNGLLTGRQHDTEKVKE